MGEPNVALGVYMNNPARIRSVLEYYLGEKLPEDWKYEELKGMYPVRDSKGKLTYRQRDLIGKACAWGTHFLLGLENQERINLIYPLRLMEMDSLVYRQEVEAVDEKNRAAGQRYEEEDDFLYRHRRGDRVKPVLNLMLYWGKKKWEKPLSLREMLEDVPALPTKLRQLAGDYGVHIIHMRQIPEATLQEMDSDLKYVLGIMKCTKSSKKYEAYIRENRDYFARIPKSAVDVIDVCTNIKDIRKHLRFVLNENNNEEEADMCYALDQIQRNAEKKGKRQGIQQGVQQMNELVRRLLADGRQEDLLQATVDAGFRQKLLAEYKIR